MGYFTGKNRKPVWSFKRQMGLLKAAYFQKDRTIAQLVKSQAYNNPYSAFKDWH
jgi:hypothetical protein